MPATPRRAAANKKPIREHSPHSSDTPPESGSDSGGYSEASDHEVVESSPSEEEVEEEEEEPEALDSDDLDAEEPKPKKKAPAKRKAPAPPSKATPAKKKKVVSDSEEEQAGSSPASVKKPKKGKGNGAYAVADVVQAPESTVPPGQIEPHTMEFLGELRENNEREWFWVQEPRYRHALKNWNEFLDALTPEMAKADWTIPELPAKDLVYRIARDVRFSNDKTPYKTNFSARWSRTGRKGNFAGYYLQISPGNKSLIGGGIWSPEKNELATIRHSIITNSKRLRKVISDPTFVKTFGQPKEVKGKRTNIFGAEDALKNAPKMPGVDKGHKDIDLLKLKTIAVTHRLTDEQVLDPDFKNIVKGYVEIIAPLVQLLNEMMVPTPREDDDEAEEEDSQEEGGGIEA